ncbi:MAG: universal stress protein [Ferrovum sp.]|nr:universal stress protein [Ferrovum sp.]NDU86608.1 universal stress protein [Ferrovum sp.]
MFTHLLIAIDGSELSHKALNGGLSLAQALKAQVTVYTCVVQYLPMTEFAVETPQIVMEELDALAERHLETARVAAQNMGMTIHTRKSVEFSPYTGIIDCAKQQGCDLIMMSSHGRRGLTSLILGSETQKVLTHSSIPVLVYR